MNEQIDELRKQYPDISPGFFDMMAERDEVQRKLDDLKMGLAHLLGFHSRDGAIPLEAVRRLLDGERGGQ